MEPKIITLELSELVEDKKTDSISGRTFGQGYSEKKKVLEQIIQGNTFKIIIDNDKIKAINDSFWKGFFSSIFEKYKSKEKVLKLFTFEANEFFINHIHKNLTILDAIYNV